MPRRSARLAAKPRVNYAALAGVRPRRRGRKPKASTTFAKKVLAVVAKKEETKYVAQQLQQVVPMGQALITPAGF